MPTYLHPGVYIEEIPSGAKTIEGVSTSITAFVGPARKGPAGEATLIHSLDEYIATYGGVHSAADAMGLSVTAYYQNGGKDAYIARLVSTNPPAATSSRSIAGEGTGGANVLKVSATSPGTWGDETRIRVRKPTATDPTFTLEVGHLENEKLVADETFSGLSMSSASSDYALTRVNGVSKLVNLALEAAADPNDPANQFQKGSLTGAALPNAADVFSGANGVKDAMTMTLNVDGLGAKKITLGTAASLALAGDNAADGAKVATAIKNAVVALGPSQTPYKDFAVVYGGDRKFVLTSGSKSSSSSVVVYGGSGADTDLAKLIKVDPASNPAAVLGAGKVVPLALPGTNDLGEPLAGGAEGAPAASDYTAFFGQKLIKIRDASIIVLPGQSVPKSGAGNDAVSAAIAHAEATQRSMVIVDPAPGAELESANDVDQLALTTSTYAALYYPWVEMTNPFFKPDDGSKPTIPVAPSSFAAGMWAKIDGRRGVWKAPAGVETSLLGVAALQFNVGDGDQDQLNPLGVNALRKLPGFGHVIWGTRTLSTKANPEWRYVPVRRTAIFIEQSVYNSIQWAVFEPNDHKLWASLRSNIDAFMNGLWRSGAFQGEKASDAYFVRCGLGDTMVQSDIDRGQVIVVVGFAPLKPAEFVIVRIQQKVAQQ
ncbi:MAG: phage tail sheath family protein [Thermoanaerobaculia bacterium]